MMTKEQILEEQIQALEKLLFIKDLTIDALEQKLKEKDAVQPMYPYHKPQSPLIGPGTITTPFITNPCTDGNHHQYPNPWFSTSPPSCTKCGQFAPNYAITSGSGTISTTKIALK